VVYDDARAAADFEKARQFFSTSIPTETNPQNLYEDIDSAFIVSMFKDSDKPCFYVLSQFRKTINANVMILSIVFSAIVSFVAVANIMLSSSVDFYGWFNLSDKLPLTLNLWVVSVPIGLPRDFFNRLVFGFASCFVGYCVMWLFYNTEYTQFQRYNGQHLKIYLVDYLAKINNNFRQIQTNAANTMLAEAPVEEMKRDAVLWITNLRWMAFRAFFIESYLKNILFQIRRNSSYYLLLVPLLFIVLLLVITSLMRLPEFNVLNLQSEIYRQNSFYLFFAVLLLAYYQYLRRSVSFIWESIEQHDWFKFREMNIQDAMTKILDAYVTQLDRWRGVMKSRT
jgi:ABC-type multidrug transport system fused ATPase/permease subunit